MKVAFFNDEMKILKLTFPEFILILGRFAKAKQLRMSYTVRNSIIKFANLFRFGIVMEGVLVR
jgi:hypothetical protein